MVIFRKLGISRILFDEIIENAESKGFIMLTRGVIYLQKKGKEYAKINNLIKK